MAVSDHAGDAARAARSRPSIPLSQPSQLLSSQAHEVADYRLFFVRQFDRHPVSCNDRSPGPRPRTKLAPLMSSSALLARGLSSKMSSASTLHVRSWKHAPRLKTLLCNVTLFSCSQAGRSATGLCGLSRTSATRPRTTE